MTKESGINMLSDIVDMGIIPGLNKSSRPNEILAALRQFLVEKRDLLERGEVLSPLKNPVLSQKEEEIINIITTEHKFIWEKENNVINAMAEQAGHCLKYMYVISKLCVIIEKLDLQRRVM